MQLQKPMVSKWFWNVADVKKQTACMAELIFNEQLGSDESSNEAVVQSLKPTGKC